MNIKQLMVNEAALITTMFKRNGIRAKVDPRKSISIATGYISYGLTVAMDERFAKVEALQRELSTVLGNARRRAGLAGDIQAIPVSFPRLALELPHPAPEPLFASNAVLTSAQPHTMLLGRSYIDGPQDEFARFDDTPHVLVVGMTGAGKSVLMQTMLLSLSAGTGPAECKFVLVDLKNEDLVPFENLPHTLTFAGTRSAALDALRFVYAEKEKRVANRGYKPYRLVTIIDEMAQLAGDSEAREILGDLASIGRSKDINLIGATQHPTEKGGLGSLLKANFPLRLTGMVSPGLSYAATGRAQVHADLLPGKGAFLRLQGPQVYRFQSYYVDEKKGQVSAMARTIGRLWASTTTTKNTASARVVEASRSGSRTPVEAGPVEAVELYQPTIRRDEIDEMADAMRPHWQPGMSKNAISQAAFGKAFAGTTWTAKVNAAIDRLTSTAASTGPSTTASTASTHTSTGDTSGSSSSSDEKIIKLKRTGT